MCLLLGMKADYYIEKIKEKTGLTTDQIKQLVDAKIEELKGLISREGASFVIAKELGVEVKSISELTTPIEITLGDITPQMKMITVSGRIMKKRPLHEFPKEGGMGKVLNFSLFDKDSVLNAVAWDDKADFINEKIKEGDLITIEGGYGNQGRNGNTELHIGKKTIIAVNPSDLDAEQYPTTFTAPEVTLAEAKNVEPKSIVSVQGTISKVEELKTITSKKTGEEISLLKFTVSDDTENIVVIMWREIAESYKGLLRAGMKASLQNVTVNYNAYTNTNEITFNTDSKGSIK